MSSGNCAFIPIHFPWAELLDVADVWNRRLLELMNKYLVFPYTLSDVTNYFRVLLLYVTSVLESSGHVEKSVLMLITHVPIVFYYLIKLYFCKVAKISTMKEASVTNVEDHGNEHETEAKRLHPKIQPLHECNKQLELDIDQKARELDAMARTVYYLQRQSQFQERDIAKKDGEIEEMARTIEYLQRPSSKRWSDVLDRVYQINCSAPQLVSAEYVYLPMVTEIEQAVPRGSDGESDSDGVGDPEADLQLEWDEWG
ncbi:uncharacterized protein LOC135467443 [Liolophura sinensis]|uniref:uncharacterized protein LOC135467443 n=1 Tax=Liolophura sinensis TaxID=3198878 RepID=UPI003158317C